MYSGPGTVMRRFAIACVVLLGLLAVWMSMRSPAPQIPTYEGPGPTAVSAYGDSPLQFGELRLPGGEGPFPVAVTIHGGCWLDRLGQGSLTPVAAALAGVGIAAWDLNYRRLGHEGGGWPGTFLDVGRGIDHLRVLAEEHPIDLDRVVLVGHSSGAQLAVWAAGRSELPAEAETRGEAPLPVLAAVGIDGPMDLATWSAEGLDVRACGDPVIATLLGGGPSDQPGRYQEVSPAEMPPIQAGIFLNPAGMVLSFGDPETMARRAQATGERVVVRPVPDSDHFQLITPEHESWSVVLETIQMALGMN